MDRCPACGTPYKSTNPGCDNHDRPLGQDEHYCDLCGSPTTLGELIDSMT